MSKVVGFKRIVTHDRAREAVNRFCNAYLNRDPHKPRPQISIPAHEDDDDMVLMDYIAQHREAEATPKCTDPLCLGDCGLAEVAKSTKAKPSSLTAQEFYEANATNIINVPRPGHPEDKSGWDGVRRASEARFIAQDALVMTLPDAFDFAEKYAAATKGKL